MSNEINFFLGICRPEIDGEDEVRRIDVTVRNETLAWLWRNCRAFLIKTRKERPH